MRWPAATNEVSRVCSRLSKGHSKLKNTDFAQQQQQRKASVGMPTQCISNSQSELFHPIGDPSYFQECHFLSCMKLQRERYPSRHQLLTKAYIATP